MLKFYITFDERDRAQKRASELDVSRSQPPGKRPYVWDNRLGAVNRWYEYASPADKIGTIYFEPVLEADGRLDVMVECTTEITHHPLMPERSVRQVRNTEPEEHRKLIEYFFRELLASGPHCEVRLCVGTW